MDAEAHLDALGAQLLGDLGDRILAVGDGEAVAGHDDHRLGAGQTLDRFVDVGEGGLALGLGWAGAVGHDGGGGAVAAEQHRADVAVHGDAHDVGEDGARRADERTDRGQHRLV